MKPKTEKRRKSLQQKWNYVKLTRCGRRVKTPSRYSPPCDWNQQAESQLPEIKAEDLPKSWLNGESEQEGEWNADVNQPSTSSLLDLLKGDNQVVQCKIQEKEKITDQDELEERAIDIKVMGECPVKGLIYTGLDGNYIDAQLVKNLGIPTSTAYYAMYKYKEFSIEGEPQKCLVDFAFPDGTEIRRVHCLLADMKSKNGHRVILGYEFLWGFKNVTLLYGGDKPGIKVTLADGNVFGCVTNMSISDSNLSKVSVDTGTPRSLICRSFAGQMDLKLHDRSDTLRVQTCDSVRICEQFCVGHVFVDDEREAVEFQVVDDLSAKFVAVLGADFIRQRKSIKIEYKGDLPPLVLDYDQN